MKKLYALLLRLFPGTYYQEFGEELKTVFSLSFEEALENGRIEAAWLVVRELASLPKAIVYEHLREMRNTQMTGRFTSYLDFAFERFLSYLDFASGSWKEFLTALLPFFLAGFAMPGLNYLVRSKILPTSSMIGTGIPLVLFGLFILLFILGLTMGLPRWSLPYLGFVLSLLSVYIFSGVLGFPIFILFPTLFDQSSLFGDIFLNGFLWYGLLATMILSVAAIRVSPTFHRFKNDWTLLCFVLYGAVPFALLLTFDEYVGDEPYTLLAFLVLALGAWVYLHSNSVWKRFGALFGALTLVMFIAAAGKAILVPTQSWPITIDPALSISEAKHTIITWIWLALAMLVPLGINIRTRHPELLG